MRNPFGPDTFVGRSYRTPSLDRGPGRSIFSARSRVASPIVHFDRVHGDDTNIDDAVPPPVVAVYSCAIITRVTYVFGNRFFFCQFGASNLKRTFG